MTSWQEGDEHRWATPYLVAGLELDIWNVGLLIYDGAIKTKRGRIPHRKRYLSYQLVRYFQGLPARTTVKLSKFISDYDKVSRTGQ